ncbi:1-phosphofructokinase [soil metagenome]
MIVSVTLNPSLDRTVEVDRLERGAVLRTSAPTLEPGGKGVNLTRALSRNGIDSIAVLPVGGPEGAELSALLDAAGVATRLVPVNGRTRSNLTVSEPDGTATKLNEPGSPLSTADFSVLATVLAGLVSARDWVVFSGSIPPECSADQLVALMTSVTDLGASLAVDTSGDALTASISARPRVIKPNRAELAEAVGRELGSISEVIVAAEELRSRGVERVLVSLGADGAVLVGEHGAIVGESTVLEHRSTVGAGDCFLAGFLSKFSADESDEESALVEALAWGAAAVGLPGTSVPGPGDIAYSNFHLVWQPDLDRPLVAT